VNYASTAVLVCLDAIQKSELEFLKILLQFWECFVPILQQFPILPFPDRSESTRYTQKQNQCKFMGEILCESWDESAAQIQLFFYIKTEIKKMSDFLSKLPPCVLTDSYKAGHPDMYPLARRMCACVVISLVFS
jgi:hypothetical protein